MKVKLLDYDHGIICMFGKAKHMFKRKHATEDGDTDFIMILFIEGTLGKVNVKNNEAIYLYMNLLHKKSNINQECGIDKLC